MSRNGFELGSYSNSNNYQDCCCCCCDNLCPEPCPPAHFTSSYIEAVGSAQDVAANSDIIFDVNPDYLDVVGEGIELNESGAAVTITRAGLYHIEWSINISDSTQPVVVGILENGAPTSALSNAVSTGNLSSGALVNATEDDLPLTIRLHNFGAALSLGEPPTLNNTAASIRIHRIADAPSR